MCSTNLFYYHNHYLLISLISRSNLSKIRSNYNHSSFILGLPKHSLPSPSQISSIPSFKCVYAYARLSIHLFFSISTRIFLSLVFPVHAHLSISACPFPRANFSSLPLNPAVTFKRLPFYDHLGELLRPTTLMPRGPPRSIEDKGVKKQISEAYYIFNLTAQQAQVGITLKMLAYAFSFGYITILIVLLLQGLQFQFQFQFIFLLTLSLRRLQ